MDHGIGHERGPIPLNRYLVFFGLAICGAVTDLASKYLIFQWRGYPGQKEIWWIWEPYFGIETAVNPGALFGMAAGNGVWFALLSIVASIGIVYWLFVRRAAHEWWLTVALGGVTGGIIGNLHDRLGLWYQAGMPDQWRHSVRDWILFRYEQYTWPNFNIADSLLVCGAIMLMWHAFFHPVPETNSTGESSSTTASSNAVSKNISTAQTTT